jgi:hypothetical protein
MTCFCTRNHQSIIFFPVLGPDYSVPQTRKIVFSKILQYFNVQKLIQNIPRENSTTVLLFASAAPGLAHEAR